MLQLIALILIIVAGKLIWDVYNQHTSKNTLKTKKKNPSAGKLIDISKAWINVDSMLYKKRDFLLSPRELGLFKITHDILMDSNYIVCPKVRLSDLLILNPDADNYQDYVIRTNEQGVDLVIFEYSEFKPIMVLLTEGDFEGKKKQLTDRFLKSALESAGLPYLMVNTNDLPDAEKLRQVLIDNGLKVNH